MATTKEVRVNDRIRIPTVRVIGPDGEQIGILPIRDALVFAQERNLDLVEVSPTAKPPVCRVMDFGKFKYEQNKKAQKAKKKQHITHLKEVKLRPKIEEHDYNFKVNHGRDFLEEHDKVKFTVTFRGRELAHPEAGMRLLERVIKDLDGIGVVEIPIRMEGRSMVLLMVPKAQAGKPVEKKPAEKKPASAVPAARSATPRAPSASAGAAPATTSATKPKP